MTTVDALLQKLPADRRAEIEAVRRVVNESLPEGYVETVDFGMLSWVVPLERYPETYNGHPLMLASLAAQKSYCSLYLMGIYGAEDGKAWFESAWKKSGKKLDMGKSCVRFQSADDLALDVVASAIARVSVDDYIARYEAVRATTKGGAKKKKQTAASTAKKKPLTAKKPSSAAKKPSSAAKKPSSTAKKPSSTAKKKKAAK